MAAQIAARRSDFNPVRFDWLNQAFPRTIWHEEDQA
jgi:hypothetical protein